VSEGNACVTDEMDHDASVPATRPQVAAAAAAGTSDADDNEIESASEDSADELQHNMMTTDDVSDKSPGLTTHTRCLDGLHCCCSE